MILFFFQNYYDYPFPPNFQHVIAKYDPWNWFADGIAYEIFVFN